MNTEQVIALDVKIAWQAEQRKPKARRRTYAQVEQAIRDLYNGNNPYAVVVAVEEVKVKA